MTIHRRAAKRDANEVEIVRGLRQLGVRVLRLSGAGVPDLAVYWPASGWLLADVKAARGGFTEAQRLWGPEIKIWRSVDDALVDLGIARG